MVTPRRAKDGIRGQHRARPRASNGSERRPLRKVQAGGIIRTSLDNTWRTPPEVLEPARGYLGGVIPFDPASGLENPTGALRFCAGRLDVVPPRTWKGRDGKLKVEPEWKTKARGRARRRSLFLGLAMGSTVRSSMFWDEDDAGALFERTLTAERAGKMPFVSGLSVDWPGPVWVNPPYGRELKAWLAKIVAEAERGTEIVGLLPCARWEQRYFHRALKAANAVCFIRGRVDFISSIDHVPVSGNPYASMLIGWNADASRWLEWFGPLGACLTVRPMRRRPSRTTPAATGEKGGGAVAVVQGDGTLPLFGGEDVRGLPVAVSDPVRGPNPTHHVYEAPPEHGRSKTHPEDDRCGRCGMPLVDEFHVEDALLSIRALQGAPLGGCGSDDCDDCYPK